MKFCCFDTFVFNLSYWVTLCNVFCSFCTHFTVGRRRAMVTSKNEYFMLWHNILHNVQKSLANEIEIFLYVECTFFTLYAWLSCCCNIRVEWKRFFCANKDTRLHYNFNNIYIWRERLERKSIARLLSNPNPIFVGSHVNFSIFRVHEASM